MNREQENNWMILTMKRRLTVYYGKTVRLLKNVFIRSIEDDISGLGAQMSYYFILAFFPFLIFLIALLSHTRITSEDIMGSLSAYLPADVYQTVLSVVNETVKSTSTTLISFGVLGTLWAASSAVEVLINGINKAYDFQETRSFWKIKFLSVLFTAALSLVYIFSLVMIVFGGLIANRIFVYFRLPPLLLDIWNISRIVIPIVTIFILFMISYNYMPAKRIGFKKVLPGAVFSTCAWMSISQIFSVYINNFGNYTRAYGSLGSIIVLLLWLYWCGITIMLGAELIASLHYFKTPENESKP